MNIKNNIIIKTFFLSIFVTFFLSACSDDIGGDHSSNGSLTSCNGLADVVIGTQTWKADNQCVDTYPNGSAIASWKNEPATNTFSYAGTDNGEESLKGAQANKDLGNLYQWDAAMNGSEKEGAQGICPNGYHVPTNAEVCKLFNYLDEGAVACDVADYTGTDSDNGAGARAKDGGSSSAKVKLVGARDSEGNFFKRGKRTNLWTSSKPDSETGIYWRLETGHGDVYRNESSRWYGYSVRCIKN
jgi:uncharacterized protein (TIGR02145 family)